MSNRMLLGALAMSVLVACGGKKDEGGGGGGKVASCNMPKLFSCREYRGANLAAGLDNLAKLCGIAGSDATFAETACPTAKVIGSCAMPTGKDYYYEGFPGDLASMQKTCSESALPK